MALLIAVGIGCILGAVYTMYNHEQHIIDYAATSLDNINDERNHILELDSARIDVLVFQDIENVTVKEMEMISPSKTVNVPVEKMMMIPCGKTMVSYSYTTFELKFIHAEYREKTRIDQIIKSRQFYVSYNHDSRIVFTNPIEIHSMDPTQIIGIDEVKNYISNNIPYFKENISFNHCFYHHKFVGKIYLHGKMIDGKFTCNHISYDKSSIIQKRSWCCLCLEESKK